MPAPNKRDNERDHSGTGVPPIDATKHASTAEASANQLLGVTAFAAVSSLCFGLPLATLPLYLQQGLNCTPLVIGLVLSVHALAMVFTRPLAGRICDRVGARRAVIIGLWACLVSGLGVLGAPHMATSFTAVLAIVGSRIALGFAQGFIGVGSLSWGIGIAGPHRAGTVISWNGIANYGTIAFAPAVGTLLQACAGFYLVGDVIVLLAAAGLCWAARLVAPPPISGTPGSFLSVFRSILPLGSALAASALGFNIIATFITLYFSNRGWPDVVWCLSFYGISFAASRLTLVNSIPRFGGLTLAAAALLMQSLGLLALWLVDSPTEAMLATAVAGAGMALVFPALGTEVVNRVAPASRGSALGGFTLCNDLGKL